MRHVNGMTAGTSLCLLKDFGKSDWELSCIGDYDTCIKRAVELGRDHKGASIMVTEIKAMAEPSLALLWKSVLGEKITKG